MTTPSKRKGDQGERDIIALFQQAGFLQAQRARAGAELDRGDIAGIPDLTCEVKCYTDFLQSISKGLLDLERETANNETRWGVLFAKRRMKGWVAVMPAEEFIALWAAIHRLGQMELPGAVTSADG